MSLHSLRITKNLSKKDAIYSYFNLIYACMHAHTHTYTCTRTCVYTPMYTDTSTHMHTQTQACTQACAYVHTHTRSLSYGDHKTNFMDLTHLDWANGA